MSTELLTWTKDHLWLSLFHAAKEPPDAQLLGDILAAHGGVAVCWQIGVTFSDDVIIHDWQGLCEVEAEKRQNKHTSIAKNSGSFLAVTCGL